MWILHARNDPQSVRPVARASESHRGRGYSRDGFESLPVWRSSADRESDSKRCANDQWRSAMKPNSSQRGKTTKETTPSVTFDGGEGLMMPNRRDFFKLLGGGIIVLIYPLESAQAQDRLPSAYLRIAEDGTISILSGKIEMGQGVMTSLAQMAAEELDVPLSSMRAVMGDTGLCPTDTDGGTWGSLTTRNFGPTLRTAAARARA